MILNKDAEITLVDETQGRYGDDIMFDVSDLAGEEEFVVKQRVPDSKKDNIAQVNTVATTVSTASTIPVSTALITDVEITLAQALAELKSAKPTTTTSTRSRAKGLGARGCGSNVVVGAAAVRDSRIASWDFVGSVGGGGGGGAVVAEFDIAGGWCEFRHWNKLPIDAGEAGSRTSAKDLGWGRCVGEGRLLVDGCGELCCQSSLFKVTIFRDMVKVGHVRILHVPSHFQYADIFTKGLPSALFEDFRSSLSVRPPPAQTAGAY
ncbi:hypothetical protein Tco_0577470 [Tanacetum coccineum]